MHFVLSVAGTSVAIAGQHCCPSRRVSLSKKKERALILLLESLLRMSWPTGKDTELDSESDAVGRKFEPYPYRRMRLHAGGALVVSQ